MKQLWEYTVEELAERCTLAENEVERLQLQWTGMKSEVELCHARIERLRALVLDAARCLEFHGRAMDASAIRSQFQNPPISSPEAEKPNDVK